MTGKQRADLRSLANTVPAQHQIGKGGAESPALLKMLSDALEANELIKIHVLNNCDYTPKEICAMLAEALGAEPVQVIGQKVVLYRPSEKHPTIII